MPGIDPVLKDQDGTTLIGVERKVGATVKDPERFQQCMDEADLAIYTAEKQEPYHRVYIIAGWIALLLSLGIVVVLTAWALRII